MSVPVAAILLAAGKSSRMGTCKQLLPLGGGTVIARCLETLVAGGIGEIVVVVSRDGDAVARAAQLFPVKIAVNDHAEGDMASSVRVGRDALSNSARGVLVALCDYPLLLPETLVRLVDEQEQVPGIIIPCHGGRRGHPLLLPRDVLESLGGDETLRDLLQRHQERIHFLDVDDPGILLDMDTPEDYHHISDMFQTQITSNGMQ